MLVRHRCSRERSRVLNGEIEAKLVDLSCTLQLRDFDMPIMVCCREYSSAGVRAQDIDKFKNGISQINCLNMMILFDHVTPGLPWHRLPEHTVARIAENGRKMPVAADPVPRKSSRGRS